MLSNTQHMEKGGAVVRRSNHPYFTNRAKPEGDPYMTFCIMVGTKWAPVWQALGRLAQELNTSRSDVARMIIAEALGIEYKGSSALRKCQELVKKGI